MTLHDLIPWNSRRENLPDRRDVESSFDRLNREMNRMIDDFFGFSESTPGGRDGTLLTPTSPKVDVSETDESIQVVADLPGLDENDIDLTVSSGMLTIRGETKHEVEDKQKNYHRVERSYGSFQRSIPLPAEVDSDKAEATFHNGVLTVVLPKVDGGENRKKIEVRRAN